MLGQLFYKITADPSNLEKGLSSARKSMSDADKTMSRTSSKISGHSQQAGKSIQKDVSQVDSSFGGLNKTILNVGKALVGAFAARQVYQSIKNLVTGLTEKADRLLDLQDITGIATDKLQEYEYVAKIAGVSTEALANASQGLTTRMARATGESSPLNLALRQLGISATTASGQMRQGSEVMDDVIDRLAQMEDVTERNILGYQVFAGAWKDMAPILSMGAEGIKEIREEAHRLGIVMSEDSLKAANELRQATVRLNTQKQALAQTLGMILIPELERSATKINTFISAMGAPIDISQWERWSRILGASVASIVTGGRFGNQLSDPVYFKAWAEQGANADRETQNVIDSLKELRDEEEARVRIIEAIGKYQRRVVDYQKMLDAELEKSRRDQDKLLIEILKSEIKMAQDVSEELRNSFDEIVENAVKGWQKVDAAASDQEQERRQGLGEIGRIQEDISTAQQGYIEANSTAERIAASIRLMELEKELQTIHDIARARALASQAGIDLSITPGEMPSLPGAISQTLSIKTDKTSPMGEEDKFWIEFQKEYQDAIAKTVMMHGALGESYDLLGNQISETELRIGQLIEGGYTLQDEELQHLIERLEELRAKQDEVKDSAVDWGMMAGGAIAGLSNEIGAMAAGAEASFQSLAGSMINSIQQIINALFAKAIASLIADGATKGLFGLAMAAGGIGALKAMWASNVPALAQGGIAKGETLAVVGEYPGAQANPEVIAPLNELTGIIQSVIADVMPEFSMPHVAIFPETGQSFSQFYNVSIPDIPEIDTPVRNAPGGGFDPRNFELKTKISMQELEVALVESRRQMADKF